VLSTISLIWVAYKSAVPLPEPPVRYAPILAAVWLVAGVVVMLTVRGAAGTPLLDAATPTPANLPPTASRPHPLKGARHEETRLPFAKNPPDVSAVVGR
jgi:hypothetical protein